MIQWLQRGRAPGGYVGDLLRDIEVWMANLAEFQASHMPREGNAAADYMARYGTRCEFLSFDLSDVRSDLLQIIRDDVSGCSRETLNPFLNYQKKKKKLPMKSFS